MNIEASSAFNRLRKSSICYSTRQVKNLAYRPESDRRKIRRFRGRDQSAIATAFLVPVVGFTLFILLSPAPPPPAPKGGKYVLCAIMIPFIFILGRGAFARVKADASGVQIRNILSTRSFQWDEIDRFELGINHATFFQLAAAVHLADGREITIFSIQGPNRNLWSKKPDLSAQHAVDELNRLLAEARADARSRTSGAVQGG